MIRILGIDPGSRATGFGVIDIEGSRAKCVTSGFVQVKGEDLASRLRVIFTAVSEIMQTYRPDEVAVESVFMHRNADSALKLGQARGAAICALAAESLPFSEYSPSQVKQAVVGQGNAAKTQVQHMVKALLKLPQTPQPDAADALAVALCHGHNRQTLAHMAGVQGIRRGRWR